MAEPGEICLIYYSTDGEEWATYVKTELELVGMKIHNIDFQQEQGEPTSDSVGHIANAVMSLVILTPQFMDLLAQGKMLHALAPNPTINFILLLGESKESFDDMNLSTCFPQYHDDKWRVFEYSDWKSIEVEISKRYEECISAVEEPVVEPERPVKDKSKKKKNELTLYPDKIRCEVCCLFLNENIFLSSKYYSSFIK